MKMLIPTCAAIVATIAAVPVSAQQTGSRETREFVQAAAQSDQFEILEGQTVLTQSRDPEVRAFAAKMIEDHQSTSLALKEAATRSGLELPEPGISGDQAMLLGALQGQQGPDFDKSFAIQQALTHRSALSVQQRYAAGGDAPALRDVAASTSRLIAGHLGMAEKMLERLNGK